MTDREQALHRLLKEGRGPEPAAPAFNRLWNDARTQAEQRPEPGSHWGDAFAAAAAAVCVLAIGIIFALDARRTALEQQRDSGLYAQLIAHTTWRSPTDVLLDNAADRPLGALPDLPTVNTNPPLESLL
jgi:hypothetical protein